jgi:hypothetical protein
MHAILTRARRRPWSVGLSLAALGTAVVLGCSGPAAPGDPPPGRSRSRKAEVLERQVHALCGACHEYPDPSTFPRDAWMGEVVQGYRFFQQAGLPLEVPPMPEVVRYYEERAPRALPPAVIHRAPGPGPVRFEQVHFPAPPGLSARNVSNINLVHLFDDKRLDVLVCEMTAGLILALSPYEARPAWRVLGKVSNPAHAEVVDLDGDGIKDILVANLGNLTPTDRLCGSVVWLRGNGDGTFTPHTLLDDVGRVADVQTANFRGLTQPNGKPRLDLVVGCFGWRNTGAVLYLENQTTDWSKPRFVKRVRDERHGTIHVPVCRLQGQPEGSPPDFIALISQEHEAVVAFLNDGRGNFRKETIFRGPHPAYGSSGIQVVDLNGDGRPDVLYTNGDAMDQPYLLKPYHSVQWLENPGRGKFPWKHHAITPMYGVYRAVAADFRGHGKKDIVAVSYLPAGNFPQRERLNLDSVLFLEDRGQGRYARHTLEAVTCDHVTCAAGDIYGTGRTDFVTGVAFMPGPGEDYLTIWRNRGE